MTGLLDLDPDRDIGFEIQDLNALSPKWGGAFLVWAPNGHDVVHSDALNRGFSDVGKHAAHNLRCLRRACKMARLQLRNRSVQRQNIKQQGVVF